MKKTFALLVALMLLVAMLPTSAMAYTAVTIPATTVDHTLALTSAAMEALPYDITYTFAQVGVVAVQNSSFTNAGMAVTGNPTIAPVEYKAGTTPDETTRSISQKLSIDWSGVEITEPGVYRWTFSKSVSSDDPVDTNLSNSTSQFYVYVYVMDNGGAQLNATVIVTDTLNGKNSDFQDNYPATVMDLSITKAIEGNQASPDQYFEFKVYLKSPVNTASMTYDIDYAKATKKLETATAYNNEFENPAQIVVPAGGTEAYVTLMMKAGETIKIPGLIYNTYYRIVETAVTGYETSAEITAGDAENVTIEGAMVEDTGLTQQGTTVKYTNKKNAEVPTGIVLNTAAPIMGILLALSLLAVLYIGKRKEYQA